MLEPDPSDRDETSAIIELRRTGARIEETIGGSDIDAYDEACNDYWAAHDRAVRLGIIA